MDMASQSAEMGVERFIIDDYEQPTGRNQYAINLQNNDAFNYLFKRLDHFLSTYNIVYIKWDMNREIVQPEVAELIMKY